MGSRPCVSSADKPAGGWDHQTTCRTRSFGWTPASACITSDHWWTVLCLPAEPLWHVPAQARLSAMVGSSGSKHTSRQDAAGKDSPNRHSKVSWGPACQAQELAPWELAASRGWEPGGGGERLWALRMSTPSTSATLHSSRAAGPDLDTARPASWLQPPPATSPWANPSPPGVSSGHGSWQVSSPARAAVTKDHRPGSL